MTVNQLRLVDVIHGGHGYRLSETDQAARLTVCRARRAVRCGLNGCAIPRGASYLYSHSEGRLCVPCSVVLGALDVVLIPEADR